MSADSVGGAVAALFGPPVKIAGREPVSGGDINRSYRLRLSDGGSVFLKRDAPGLLPMFLAEARGLEALGASGTVGVPRALAAGRAGVFPAPGVPGAGAAEGGLLGDLRPGAGVPPPDRL